VRPRRAFLLVAFLACGFTVLSCGDSGPIAPERTGVYLASLKTSYQPGEEIQILLANETDGVKVFASCREQPLELYRFVENEWQNVSGMCTMVPAAETRLPAHSELNFPRGKNVGYPTGLYRVGERICDDFVQSCEWVYSEPFTLSAE
jgi:hypothetical protein